MKFWFVTWQSSAKAGKEYLCSSLTLHAFILESIRWDEVLHTAKPARPRIGRHKLYELEVSGEEVSDIRESGW